MSRVPEYAVRIFLSWLNERYRRSFVPSLEGEQWRASDSEAGDLAIEAALLYEPGTDWPERTGELEARLDGARPGSYLLWVPPGGELPQGEPEESEWVRRVVLAASRLASGRSGEARLPVKLGLGKVRDEGGYASVTGGLGRHWSDISQRLEGSYYLDSRGLNRFTLDEEERTQLFDHIGLLSQGLSTGDFVEIEHEDAWSLQRLPRGPATDGMQEGWAIAGCPPGFDPNDGSAVRRLLRKTLSDAAERLKGVKDASRVLVLVGAYDYMEGENAGPSLRGFDPALASTFDVIALVSDAETKALRLSRGLPFLRDGAGA